MRRKLQLPKISNDVLVYTGATDDLITEALVQKKVICHGSEFPGFSLQTSPLEDFMEDVINIQGRRSSGIFVCTEGHTDPCRPKERYNTSC